MKTTDADIPVLLVGGGAILAPDTLSGASRVVKPAYSSVANAIGAGMYEGLIPDNAYDLLRAVF
jgi:hypothetical protein